MSPRLVGVNVDSRQTDIKTIRTSRIPNSRLTNSTSSAGRHGLFSVSATGSPQYTATSLPLRTVAMPPAAISKIPRKGQTLAQAQVSRVTPAAQLQQSIMSRSCSGHDANKVVLPSHMKISPSSIRDKPLPSPPVVQVIDPNSPPKAQRTLVDAEAGSPTDEEWPILRPENESPPNQLTVPQQRSMSEGSKIPNFSNSGFKTRTTGFSITSAARTEINRSPLSVQFVEIESVDATQTTSHGLGPRDPYMSPFHAISTRAEIATKSPLSHKKSATILMFPRTSSELSSSSLSIGDTLQSSDLPSSVKLQHDKSAGITEWPVIEMSDLETPFDRPSSVPGQHTMAEFTTGSQPQDSRGMQTVFEPVDTCNTVQSRYGSIDSNSMWSMVAGSSLADDPHNDYENNTRFRRLSWHSTACGKASVMKTGPLLMIDGDADTILLGPSDSIPEMPALPEQTPEQVAPPRLLSALAECISKQSITGAPLDNLSRTSTPRSSKNIIFKNSFAKIHPIRSMQPPRKASVEKSIGRCSPLTTPTSIQPEKVSRLPTFSSITKQNTTTSFEEITTPDSSLTRTMYSPDDKDHDLGDKVVIEANDNNTGSHPSTILDISQNLSIELEKPPVPARSNMRNQLPSHADGLTEKQTDINLRNTSSPLTIEHLGSCKSASGTVLSSPNLLTAHDSGRSVGPSKLIDTSGSTHCHEVTVEERSAPSTGATQPSQSIRVSSSFTIEKTFSLEKSPSNITKVNDMTTKKIKAKRSFRDIFHRREVKHTEKPPKSTNPKRSSMAGITLPKRFRESTNLSKVSTTRVPELRVHTIPESAPTKITSEIVAENTNRHAALSSLEGASPVPVARVLPSTHYDTASVINQIIARVTFIPSDSPDRLRSLEIAEAVLHAVECSKEARMSAEMAKKHAHDAELNAERAGAELKKLQKLCEPDFDGETSMAIKELLERIGLVGKKNDTEHSAPSE